MFAIERQQKIKEQLLKEKHVDVSNLSEMFSVSEVTIRRDLDKLEREGFIIKTYGGAILNEERFQRQTIVEESEDELKEDKKLIATIACQMVDNGEAVFIGPGTTCLEVAKNIKKRRLTVITNDMLIAMELKDCPGIKVIVTGGDLIHSTSVLVGHFSQQVLKGIYIDKAIIGVKGVSTTSGYTVNNYEQAMLLREVSKISKEIIIVADYTKFDRTAFARLGDLTMAQKVVTNKQVAPEFKKYFFEHAIKLYTTYEFE
ncbi:MAG: DeoR/GlpR family DNA-binding transcription regulator [Mahellales bacterium]|jgi:DeoR family fructose operon transcriptional repressor